MGKNNDLKVEWFYSYIENIENNAIHEEEGNEPYNCPCCNYPTLSSRGDYDICDLCNWEDDGQDSENADEIWYGPNKDYSLTEARNNFKKYLTQYRPSDNGFYQSPEKIIIKKEIVELFDNVNKNNNTRIIKDKIQCLFKKLYTILCKEIALYESKISFIDFDKKNETCPCCNLTTLLDKKECDICFICNWKKIPEGLYEPEDLMTIEEAKRNFSIFYTIYNPIDKEYLKQNIKEVELKNQIISIYKNKDNLTDNYNKILSNTINQLLEQLKIKEEKFLNSEILVDDL